MAVLFISKIFFCEVSVMFNTIFKGMIFYSKEMFSLINLRLEMVKRIQLQNIVCLFIFMKFQDYSELVLAIISCIIRL